jgi:4-hydroxybenzoate polyprenyltransferase
MMTNHPGTSLADVGDRKWGLKLEGCVWLTRPQSLFSQVPIALAAWSVGRGGLAASEVPNVLLLVLFLMAFQAAMFVVNDLYDAHRDKISAPYMPIPSGVVSRRAAIAEAALLGTTFVGCIFALAQDSFGIVAVLITIPAALGTMKLYGATKSAWFSPLLGSTTFASAALWAWLLAGRGNFSAFAVLFTVAALHGIHANVRAQLRDIEGDPRAGAVTLAARMGAKRTMWIAALVRLVELGGVAWLLVAYGRRGGWLYLAAALTIFAVAMARMPQVYSRTRDRIGQTEALSIWAYVSFMAEIAILGAFEPAVALPTAVIMFLWFKLMRTGYYHRLASGRLAAEFGGVSQRGIV